ncbi:hypothetical protein NKH77_45680 [Streptomyces sp. M19]
MFGRVETGPTTSPTMGSVSGQYRWRWKAYVGGSTWRAATSANTGSHETRPPWTNSSASEATIRRAPPSPRRSVPTTTPLCPVLSSVS